MKFLRWLKRVLTGIRDRVVWILTGIFGPPYQALKRVLQALRDKLDAIIHQVLEWWANIWRKRPKDEKESLGKPSIATPLLAAFVLAAGLYSWPSWTKLSEMQFGLATTALWLVSFLVLRNLSLPAAEGKFSDFLREAGNRPGLIWWERGGAVLALIVLFFCRFTPHLFPLGLAVTFGFVRILVTKYELRELRRLREPPLVPPAPVRVEDEDRGEYVNRSFQWTLRAGILADDNDLAISVHVPTYQRMSSTNPQKQWNGDQPRFDKWIVDGSTEEVDRAAASLLALSKSRNYSTFAEISNVLAFVQSIAYSLDSDSKNIEDYWRYPIETLYDETGDCEDTTILAAAVLRRLGHRVGTMLLPGHAALAVEAPPGTPGEFIVQDGRAMYYCETTDRGWKVGEVPPSVRDAAPRVFMVPE